MSTTAIACADGYERTDCRGGQWSVRRVAPWEVSLKILFIAFIASLVSLLGVAISRLQPPRLRIPAFVGLITWLGYATAMGYWGSSRIGASGPPLPLFFLVPAVALVLFMARSSYGDRLAAGLPASVFIGMESFRIVVELFLHQLWLDGLVPKMITFEGANYDILVGVSAPLIAWLVSTRRVAPRIAIAWSVVGILMLLNVIVRSVLTTPGPTHWVASDVANRAITQFPYTFIPAFLAPLAMLLHVLSIRALARAESANPPSSHGHGETFRRRTPSRSPRAVAVRDE